MQFYKKHPKKFITLLIVALLIIFHAPPPEIYVQVDAPAGFSQLPVRIKLIQSAVSGGRNWHGGLRSYDLGTIWVKPNTREILQPDDVYYSTGILPSVYHPTMKWVINKSNTIDWKGNFEGEMGEYERLWRWFMRIFIQPSPIEITFNMLPLEEAVDLDLQKSLRGRGVKTLEEAGLEHNKQSAVVQTVQPKNSS